MDLNTYVKALRDDLLTAAAVGDDEIRRAASALSSAIEPATRLAIMAALSDFAAEVTRALGDVLVDARLDGRDVKVSVTKPEAPSGAGAGDTEPESSSDDRWAQAEHLRRVMTEAGGELSRTTLRLFNDLKSQAERQASDEGVSLNTYISRAVSEAVRSVPDSLRKDRGGRGPGRNGGSTTGFIQS